MLTSQIQSNEAATKTRRSGETGLPLERGVRRIPHLPMPVIPPSLPIEKPAHLVWFVRFLIGALSVICQTLLVIWASLAIYWSNLPWPCARLILAVVFMVGGIVCLGIVRTKRSFQIFALTSFGVLIWWGTIQPTHQREWKPEVSVLPRAVIDGDRVKLSGVRQFEYRSATDFMPRYEEREVDLSHLQAVDLFVSYWKMGPVAHTFVSFDFDNAPPVCISIEARLEKGEIYSPLASCFKQAELIYVVGDERDIVRLRTQYRNETVFLYRTRAKADGARKLFLSYLNKINQLADEPEFYHLLSNNCTVNIDRHAQRNAKRSPFDFRLLLNGYVDGFAYAQGILDTSVPFPELRQRSEITALARAAASDVDFSIRIRENLPKPMP